MNDDADLAFLEARVANGEIRSVPEEMARNILHAVKAGKPVESGLAQLARKIASGLRQ